MKIVILTAMDKELALVRDILADTSNGSIHGTDVIYGKLRNHEVILCTCGIGKVNAAVKTFAIIKQTEPDLIVNSGVAGGAGLPIGSVLIADKVAYDDVWCGPGTSFGQADGCPLFFTPDPKAVELAKTVLNIPALSFGLICSGDKFISSPEEISFIRSHFPDVKAVDMESAAIAQVCFMTKTPFNIIRVVSDTPGEGENISQYKDFWSAAPAKTFEVVKTILSNLEK